MLKRSFFQPFTLSFAILAAGLVGCTNTQLAPLQVELPLSVNTAPAQLAHIVVVDQRAQHHVLRLHHNKKPAQFATLKDPMATLIRQQLSPYFQHQSDHNLLLQINIDQGLCVAEESFSRHAMTCTLVLDVTARLPTRAWTKTYTAKRSRSGKFKLTANFVQTDLVFILSSALQEFIHDPEFHTWLNAKLANTLANALATQSLPVPNNIEDKP